MTAKRPATRRTTDSAGPKPRPKAKAKAKTGTQAGSSTRTVAATVAKTAAARTKTKSGKKVARSTGRALLRDVVLGALSELKAVDVRALDVRGITDITDTMVVASGTSDRHVKSIADRVVQRCKEAGYRPYGMEGERDGEWVLLDLQDVVLHVMLPRVREFYALEKLWEGGAAA
jgi:ribosome-associated protein